MQSLVRQFWEEHALNADQPVLLGLSGGADSTALLLALRENALPVVAAHLDHGLRAASAQDAQAVAALCREWNVPLVTTRLDVRSLARERRLSLEDAARQARYGFLFEQAETHQAQAVMVAHTADDQAETVLMHLITGSGLAGLRGMRPWALPNPWSEHIPLARPLLNVRRAETVAFCRTHDVTPLEDASNQERYFLRNRLRLDVLPLLEGCNPQVHRALNRTADILAEADAALHTWMLQALPECVQPVGRGWRVDVSVLTALPVALQRRVLRHLLAALGVDQREVGFDGLEGLRRFVGSERPAGQYPLAGEVRVWREYDAMYLMPAQEVSVGDDWPQLADAAPLDLPIPGVCRLPGGWKLTTAWVGDDPKVYRQAQGNRDPWRAWISLEGPGTTLKVRAPVPGDVLEPLGMPGQHVKISDLMSNLKVPRRARARWPLVCQGDEIVWVTGLRNAHPCRVQPESRYVALLTCYRD